jgi:hypothetical protein
VFLVQYYIGADIHQLIRLGLVSASLPKPLLNPNLGTVFFFVKPDGMIIDYSFSLCHSDLSPFTPFAAILVRL